MICTASNGKVGGNLCCKRQKGGRESVQKGGPESVLQCRKLGGGSGNEAVSCSVVNVMLIRFYEHNTRNTLEPVELTYLKTETIYFQI